MLRRQSRTPDLDAYCRAQRQRIRDRLARAHRRYLTRVGALDPRPAIETRGTPQTWDSAFVSQRMREWVD